MAASFFREYTSWIDHLQQNFVDHWEKVYVISEDLNVVRGIECTQIMPDLSPLYRSIPLMTISMLMSSIS